jgi:hypothetical protein
MHVYITHSCQDHTWVGLHHHLDYYPLHLYNDSNNPDLSWRCQSPATWGLGAYWLQPAHSWYSSLNCLRTSWTDGRIPSKTQALWCLQISQDVNMIKEFTPFLLSLTLRIVLVHQLANEHSLLHGVAPPTSSGDKMANQTCLERTHLVRRWWMISSSWSNNGHFSGWSILWRARRPAVQHRFLMRSHMKNLHFLGAQHFHIWHQGSKVT